MPATEAALAVTDAYRGQLVELRDDVARVVAGAWAAQVTLDDLSGSGRRWVAAAVAVIGAAQVEAARLTAGYLAAFVAAELDEPPVVRAADWRSRAGRTTDGRAIGLVLSGSVVAVKRALAQRRPKVAALAAGQARALRVARTEPMDAARASFDELTAGDQRIAGWRRVTSSNPCGACLGAATGAIQRTARVLHVHPACRCTKEPVVAGVRERVNRPTGQEMWDAMSPGEQDALFAGTGGPAKAELIRAGKAALADLVERRQHHQWHDTITERSLAGLLGT